MCFSFAKRGGWWWCMTTGMMATLFFCRAHSMVSFLVSTRCIVDGAKLYGSEWLEWRWARPWPRPFVGGPRLVLARFLLRDRTADRDASGASPWRRRSGGAGGGSVRQRSGPWWAQQWAAKPAPGPKKLHQPRGGPPKGPKILHPKFSDRTRFLAGVQDSRRARLYHSRASFGSSRAKRLR